MEGLITSLKQIPAFLKILGIDIKNIPFKIWNAISRPKLIIKFEVADFEFTDKNGQKSIYNFPFFSISNNKKSDIKINSSLTINNSQYYGFRDFYDKGLAIKISDYEEFLDKHYLENHLNISQRRSYINIKNGETKIFPFIRLGSALNCLTEQKGSLFFKKEKSLLFNNKDKISLTLNYNGKDYEYELSRKEVYEKYFNFLAGYMDRRGCSRFIV